MARQRELLSLTDIAEETGISYATLRNYVIKFGEEIPSEGFGRDTRYPRTAVKVFQRLRKESKPGRKPNNPLAVPAPQAPAATAAITAPLRREPPAPASAALASLPALPPMTVTATVDTSGIERELAAIRVQLERIADARIEALRRRNARLEAAPPAAPQPVAAAPVAAVPAAQAPDTAPPAQEQAPAALPERREGVRDLEAARISGYSSRDNRARSRHAWPAAPGRKGPRPE